MVRKIVIAIAFIFAISLNAQDGTVSPYSYYGIGELRTTSSVENQMMGGIGMYTDSIHVSLSNPAAYSKLRLTAYSGGISYKQLSLNNAAGKENSSITNLDYLSVGFPVAKGFGVGFGLNRYSSVGYNFESETQIANADGSTTAVVNLYSGTGGINKVYLSAGYQFTKNLSFGITANYNFGTLDNERAQSIEDIQFGTTDRRQSRIFGMDFNYALNYEPKITDKLTLTSSVRINTQANLSGRNRQQIGSFSTANGASIEILDVDLEPLGLEKTALKIPTTTTIGLGIGENKKWFLGGEYSSQKLSGFTNEFIEIDNFSYQDASTIALGGYFIPDYTSFTGYLNRVTYRAGVRVENTGMVINNTEINNFGITFGVGLPLATGNNVGFSNINLGFEVGNRGTTDANLIKENYYKVNIGLSLNDRWFIKRKIN